MTDTELKQRLRSIVDDIKIAGDSEQHQMVGSILCTVLATLNMNAATTMELMNVNCRFADVIVKRLSAARN